jgi:hypothetical protein
MRKAAGILMIIYGVIGIGSFVGLLIEHGFDVFYGSYTLALSLIVIISAVFFTAGGVFCLKRQYWKICFASSLCLLLSMIYDLHFLLPLPLPLARYIPAEVYIVLRYLPLGILPLIFICLRKREWQAQESKA